MQSEKIAGRRSVIRQIVESENSLAVAALKKRLADRGVKVSLPTLRKDLTELSKSQFPISYTHGKVEFKAQAQTIFEARCEEDRPEKQAIARVAEALVLGDNPEARSIILDKVEEKIGWAGYPVAHLLKRLWHKADRTVTLDAGSTTLFIAQSLRGKLPTNDCSAITVLTNSPAIVFDVYRSPGISTIIVGGELRRDRYSVVGTLAQRSIEAFDLVTDVSFVGATGVDPHRGFASDSPLEAHTKMRLLELSRIRCIVLDHSKLDQDKGVFSLFAGFSPSQIDFVIIDDEFRNIRKEFEKEIKSSKICLLTPNSLGFQVSGKSTRPASPA